MVGRALLVAVAGCAATAATATASVPPAQPLVFDPVHGSLGGVRLDDPLAKLVARFGKPDRVFRSDGEPLWIWMRNPKVPCSTWAVASPATGRPGRVADLRYTGPVRTSRGERTGTPLAVVRRHWKRWRVLARGANGASQGPSLGALTSYGSAAFGFDKSSHLAGVALHESTQYWQPVVTQCR